MRGCWPTGSSRSASRWCSRASRAARPAPRSSATFCCPASPSRSARKPRRSCSRPRATITCAPPSGRRWTAGKWVICDRFIDSTRVYQGVLGKVDAKLIRSLERVTVGAAMPDLTFILDVPANVGLARAKRRRGKGATDRFEAESIEFHEELRRAYLALAEKEPKRCVVIDGRAPRDVVAERIWTTVEQRLHPEPQRSRRRRRRRERRRGRQRRPAPARNRRAVRPCRGRARAARGLQRRPHSACLADRRAARHRQGDAGLSAGALRARASRSARAGGAEGDLARGRCRQSGRAPHRRAGARRSCWCSSASSTSRPASSTP